jgi:uncharacterized membrane protein (UPF0127 family)
MEKRISGLLLIGGTIVMVAFLIEIYFYFQELQKGKNNIFFVKEENSLKSYNFILSDTLEKRIQGLSGRDSLPDNTVMLFDFGKEDNCGIWMKDMKFSIDAVWLNSEFKVLDFKESISPDTFPQIFSSIFPCRYLIEAREGFVKENKIERGDKVSIDFVNLSLKITKNRPQQ